MVRWGVCGPPTTLSPPAPSSAPGGRSRAPGGTGRAGGLGSTASPRPRQPVPSRSLTRGGPRIQEGRGREQRSDWKGNAPLRAGGSWSRAGRKGLQAAPGGGSCGPWGQLRDRRLHHGAGGREKQEGGNRKHLPAPEPKDSSAGDKQPRDFIIFNPHNADENLVRKNQ